MTTLTQKKDWDKNYNSTAEIRSMNFGWRYRMNDIIAERMESLGLNGKRILEIGAGDSQWLPHFARKYSDSRFVGLDYSEAGCARLEERANKIAGAKSVDIYNRDMFAENSDLLGRFDVVISLGVVEHFTDLSNVLAVKKTYLSKNGSLFTLIPNLAGSIGYLAKKHNRSVYEMHNPHDWESFASGHAAAGLEIADGGYLGSVNFGVLSSCYSRNDRLAWQAYMFLTRISLAVWWAESKLMKFPTSRQFSPYIYAISSPK